VNRTCVLRFENSVSFLHDATVDSYLYPSLSKSRLVIVRLSHKNLTLLSIFILGTPAMSSTHSYHQMKPIPANYNHLVPTTYPEGRPEPPSQLQQEISTTKKRVRAVRMLSRTGSVIFNSIIFAIMAFVTSIFLSTRHDKVNNRNVWPADSKTWPTYMLLTASLVTLALEVFILCAYWFRYSRAEKSWKLVLVEHLAHFLLWLVVTFLYRYEKTLNDVWGWSCSDIAKTLQEDLNSSVNFARLCVLQVGDCHLLSSVFKS
jgi:hypothetical protein